MGADKTFLIYQLLLFSEADKLGLIDHDIYKEMISNMIMSFKETISQEVTNGSNKD